MRAVISLNFLVAADRLTSMSVGSVSDNHSLSLLPQTELEEVNTKCAAGINEVLEADYVALDICP